MVGLSVLSGAHNALVPRVKQALVDRGLDDVLIVVGGIIPAADMESLRAQGVAGVFPPASSISEIVEFITESVSPRT